MPARAPASMLMLQIVMRPSIESARIAEPAYSITQPVAPSVPILPMMARMMSFAVTPLRQFALDGDAKGLWLRLRQASAWPARAPLRWCRCRKPARRMRRAC